MSLFLVLFLLFSKLLNCCCFFFRLELSRAQNRQAVRRIEAALRSTSQIAVQPAALRSEKPQPHPLVAALLAGGKRHNQQQQQQQAVARRGGGKHFGGGGAGAGSLSHRFHPYSRRS